MDAAVEKGIDMVATATAIYVLRDTQLVRVGADGKSTKLASFVDSVAAKPKLAVTSKGVVIALVGNGLNLDTVLFATDDATTATTHKLKAGGATNLLAVDDAGRAWFRRDGDVVAIAADGVEHAFPNGSLAAMPYDDSLGNEPDCFPIGGGFAQLPPAEVKHKGKLELSFKGARGGAVELCGDPDDRNKGSPCAGRAERITGTLDAEGKLSLEVPTGTYESAIRLDGAWYVTDGSSISYNSTNYRCEILSGESCTIEMAIRK